MRELSPTRDFAQVAVALREEILAYAIAQEQQLTEVTVETNSGLARRRGATLEAVLDDAGGPPLAGSEVLDAGCGFGALALYFAARGARVVAIDPNGGRLEVGRAVAERFGLPVEFVRGRMEDATVGRGPFDVAVMNNSLCYVVARDKRLLALTATRRALRPGGRLVLRNPNRWSLRDRFSGLPLVGLLPPDQAVAVAAGLGRSRSRVRLQSHPDAMRELRRAGFQDVRHHPARDPGRGPLELVTGYQHLTARREAAR